MIEFWNLVSRGGSIPGIRSEPVVTFRYEPAITRRHLHRWAAVFVELVARGREPVFALSFSFQQVRSPYGLIMALSKRFLLQQFFSQMNGMVYLHTYSYPTRLSCAH